MTCKAIPELSFCQTKLAIKSHRDFMNLLDIVL